MSDPSSSLLVVGSQHEESRGISWGTRGHLDSGRQHMEASCFGAVTYLSVTFDRACQSMRDLAGLRIPKRGLFAPR